MPFEVQCDQCSAKFRAADKLIGKRVKCPKCQAVILVGAAPEEKAARKPSAGSKSGAKSTSSKRKVAKAKPIEDDVSQQSDGGAEWHVQLGEGEEYGPVTKTELDSWVAEGRLDGNCQLLKEGWDQWKWADDVYPELAESDEGAAEGKDDNPFAGLGENASPAGEVAPFVPPQEAPATVAASPTAEDSAITPKIRRALAETRPWVMLLAVLGFIVGGLGALGALLFLAMVAIAAGAPGLLVGLAMLVSPILYIVAAYFLMTYALRIGSFLRTGAVADLENAMMAQKSFWKLVGIVTTVILVLYFVMIVMMLVLGASLPWTMPPSTPGP